ncbi:MAG: hypothetical protein M3046_10730 [Actinomycetota bacterium]|jgi:hypothetical protein|nr:hypothetical protein [Actinomycetota bacterium]
MDIHAARPLPPGTSVAVFNRYSASWISGFEVVTTFDDGYEVRRRSDDTVLPKTFPVDDLRADHR